MDANEIAICKSITSLTIIKVILRNTNSGEDIKFIFVGFRPDHIKNILTKLEKKQKITSNEIKELETAIPHYTTKFGNITDYNVHFVYKYLEENLSINHARIVIYEAIKDVMANSLGDEIYKYQPNNMLLYKYSRNLDYKHYVNQINYIFENNMLLTNEEFFNRLYKLTFLNKNEINKKLKELLPAKYKHLSQNEKIDFITNETYNYEDCLINENIFHLLISVSTLLTIKYNYVVEGNKFIYYGYQNIDVILELIKSKNTKLSEKAVEKSTKSNDTHNKSDDDGSTGEDKNKDKDKNKSDELDIKFFLEHTLTEQKNENTSMTLLYFNKTVNNEYFIITYDDVKDKLPENMLDFYFPNVEKASNRAKNDKTYLDIYNRFKLTTIRKHIYDDNILTIKDCFCRNIIFDSLSNKLQIKYDLKNIYNNLATNYYKPVIKYVSAGEVKYIKLSKQFLMNHDYIEINKLLVNTDILKNSAKYNLDYLDYIQHKWRINKNIVLTINFYENGYVIVYFDDDNNLRIGDTLLQYLHLVIITIKYIKKIINAKKLVLPNITNIFNEYSSSINYSTLLNGNIILNGKLDVKKLQTAEEFDNNRGKINVKLLLVRIKKYFSSMHQFIAKDVQSNSLKFFYKQVNKFYSDESIINLLMSSTRDLQEKPGKQFLDSLFRTCSNLFFVDMEYVKKLYDNLENIQVKVATEKLLYGIEIEIKIDNEGNIDLRFENVDKYYSVKLIQFYFKVVLSNIAHDIEKGIINEDLTKKSTSISKTLSKAKSHSRLSKRISDVEENENGADDMEFDFDINLDIDIDLNLDVSNKLEDEDIDTSDNGKGKSKDKGKATMKDAEYDLDIKDLARLIQFDKLPDEKSRPGSDKSEGETYKNLELVKFFGKNKKLTFTKYMNEMRNFYDKELFNPEMAGNQKYEYNRKCGTVSMRQPYIVSKKDIESYDDPEAFNGYIKYRGNYYICPRIWDYKANRPISVKKFIENGLKSPYTNGTYIPPDKRTKIELDDKYTVIVRKPISGSEWEDPDKHKDWPEILKKTEKEAYPSLMDPSEHPGKLCVPCCGSKKPEDFDLNKKEIQQILKPACPKICRQKLEEENADEMEKGAREVKQDILVCSSNLELQYIYNETNDLEKCRLGLLPKNLDIILNNHQNLFLKNQNQLLDNSNLLLRIGVENNKKDNILETFSVIYKMSLQGLKNLIADKLTPEVFITLNNGELIDIYSSNNILPNSLYDYDKFAVFMKNYILFFNILDIDYSILERLKYKDIEFLNIHIEDNTQLTNYINNAMKQYMKQYTSKTTPVNTGKTTILEDLMNLKKLIIAYKIYTAFYNYIGHLLNDNEYKNYTHFLDLFSKPIEWLNKDGANILIFDKNCSKMLCNPYTNMHRSRFIILIREDNFHFVPVVHINNIYRNNIIEGIFTWNKINISETAFHYFEKRTNNKRLLELTKTRDSSIVNLIIIHSNICKYQYQQQTNNFIRELAENDIKTVNQIAFTTTQIEFIKMGVDCSGLLIPIYPTTIDIKNMNNKFKILEVADMCDLDTYIKILATQDKVDVVSEEKPVEILKNKMKQYNYKISKIFFDEVKDMINGIQFINNLIVPIKPEKYTIARKNEIIELLIKSGELKSLEDPRIPALFKPAYFDFQLEISPQVDIINIRDTIYKDFIYNYFKYDFSRLLQDTSFKQYRNNIVKKLDTYSKNADTFQGVLDDLILNITDIMKKRIIDSGRKIATTNGKKTSQIKLKVCSKTKKYGKCMSQFCALDTETKQCYLDMNPKQMEYFAYLLANDLLNNKLETREIIAGSFIPEFNMRNKIFRNPDEIIINTGELVNIIENGIYSKFKKNITLSEYLNNEDEYIFSTNDYKVLEDTNLDEFKSIMNNIIPEVVDLSIKNIFIDDKIFTTPFDKSGKYDSGSNIGECKFPFFDKNKKKFAYQCMQRNGGLMCPTKIDYQRRPDKWGFCPEKIEETKKALKVIDIETVGDDKEYQKGQCAFPFLHKDDGQTPQYKLKYDCIVENEDNKEDEYSWCPIYTAPTRGKTKKNHGKMGKPVPQQHNDLLRASEKFENVKMNAWYDGKLTLSGIATRKYNKGYCQPPPVKTKKIILPDEEEDENLPEITLENYIPGNCGTNFTPSKGGYKRAQLFKFGKNYLKIPYSQMMKNNETYLQKDELCKIINNKYREIKTHSKMITNEDRINAYEKDINDCEKGESKGGYSLNDLKEIAINYYNIDEEQVKDMKKEALCGEIKQIRRKLVMDETVSDENIKDIDEYKLGSMGQNMVYPGDINTCKETPNRGGLPTKEIKKVAQENFGIDTEHKHKDEICDEIEKKLKTVNKKVKKADVNRDTRISASKISKLRYSFNDLFENPEKLEVDEEEDAEEQEKQDEEEKSILTKRLTITSDDEL